MARSFNPSNRQPASQNDDRIRVMKTASNRPLLDGVDSIAVPEEIDGDPRAHSPALRKSLAQSRQPAAIQRSFRDGPVVESDLCGTGVKRCIGLVAERSAVRSPPDSSGPD